jgi:hypothetical protein
VLYVERWLKAPMQRSDGTLIPRVKGTPQGSPISPCLANLFLHYGLDAWMERNFPTVPFETSCVNPLGEKDVQTTMSSGRASVYARVGGRAEPAWEPGAHPPGAPWRPPHADGAQARKAKSESPPGGPSNRKRKRALPLRSSAPEPPCG